MIHPWIDRLPRLREMWAADYALTAIAEVFGVTPLAVKRARKRYGLPPRKNGRPTPFPLGSPDALR